MHMYTELPLVTSSRIARELVHGLSYILKFDTFDLSLQVLRDVIYSTHNNNHPS